MSKMDALRAMRESRYEKAKARATKPAVVPRPAQQPTAKPPVAPPVTAAPDTELCGHRNMSGRTCTRERGHTAKSHRYS